MLRTPRRVPRLALGLCALGLLLGAGCDLPAADDSEPITFIASSSPADGDEGVPVNARFRLETTELLLPRTVHRGTVYAASGPHRPFLSIRYSPVSQAIVVEPISEMEAGVSYRLVADGLRSLEGWAQDEPFEARFTVEANRVEPEPEISMEPARALLERCQSCHLGASAPRGLSLDAAGVEAAKSEPAWQGPSPRGSSDPTLGATSFPTMPRIDVVAGSGRPATSYLLYKLLGDPRVEGQSMPPPDSNIEPATDSELRALEAFILAGANPASIDLR